MNAAVFTAQEGALPQMGMISFEGQIDKLPLSAITTTNLTKYEAVFVLGSPYCQPVTALTSVQAEALWDYVKQGGTLYGEMIDAYDFPTSRLLGWKQEYPRTVRTVEKLCVSKQELSTPHRSLLEWSGAYTKGFRIFGESWLGLGTYPSTHHAGEAKEGGSVVPGLIVHQLGEGKVIYAAFPMLQALEPWSHRPHWLWKELFEDLSDQTGLPIRLAPPIIRLPELSQQTPSAVQAVQHTIQWFMKSGILPDANGSEGVYENVHSITAQIVEDRRPDCHAHAALLFHLYGRYSGKKQWSDISEQLMQYLLDGEYQDLNQESESYGFFKWYQFPEALPEQIFTDDNAWVCFVLLYLYRKTGKQLYKERGLLVAEALYATQQDNGLRANCLSGLELRGSGKNTAKYSREASMNPHFESIAHSAFIQAYLVTKENKYVDVALSGSLYLLEHQEDLSFMYSRTSGLNRFLLPLVYLIPIDQSGVIQRGVDDILSYLLSNQHPCGGIEEADNPDPEKYGKEDTGVFRYNGEGIADQLYTNNFLLMNAWEGWKQTGHVGFKKLSEELASFLCSIQIESEDDRFNGGWMRAFDMHHWEYFGNNGDTGWGPYCIESGWTQAIIGSGLLLQLLDESIYE